MELILKKKGKTLNTEYEFENKELKPQKGYIMVGGGTT